MPDIRVLRGLPCAGKSAWVEAQKAAYRKQDVMVWSFSADDFFTDRKTGVYEFIPAGLSAAHAECLRRFHKRLSEGLRPEELVLVDNTNLRAYEIAPYYQLAKALSDGSWDIKLLEFRTDISTILARNHQRQVKQLTCEKLLQMERTLLTEDLPLHWKRQIILG